jgi:hypothetical protein
MSFEVGPTEELSLRVSVATLSRVIFQPGDDGQLQLALEHKAHVHQTPQGPQLLAQAQPLGGGIRLLEPEALADHLGRFHFDSPRSKQEQDFRLFIRPSCWNDLLSLMEEELKLTHGAVVESEPGREIEEELFESLGLLVTPDQYSTYRLGLAVEKEPTPTHSWRAPGQPTARVYAIDEVVIADEVVCARLLAASREQTTSQLLALAQERSQSDGHGRANGVLVVPVAELQRTYKALPFEQRSEPLPFSGTVLSSNVVVLFPEVVTPRYEFIGLRS